MKSYRYLLSGMASLVFAGAAAADPPKQDTSATINGITLYGIVDLGLAYQTHGAPLNSDYYTGLEYVVSKNSNKSVFTIAPSGMSQSRLGIKGLEDLGNGWSALFKLQMDFNPESGAIGNSSNSLVQNAGVPLNQQNTNADGSRMGQAFAGAAYTGVSSTTYGTLTLGRQTAVLTDSITSYDPQGASYAFSVLGYSGFIAGGGATQDTRLDDSAKYAVSVGPVRAAALYQFHNADGYRNSSIQGMIGVDYGSFSADAVYAKNKNAISAGGLSAAQVANPLIPAGSLTATVSDNEAYAVMAKLSLKPLTAYAGAERIFYANPSSPLNAGFTDEGGFYVSPLTTTNTAYTNNRVMTIFWAGLKYAVLPYLDVTGAYYRLSQNSFHKDDGCSSNAFAQCGGFENAVSVTADFKLSKRWDAYAGVMYTEVGDGLASGFLHTSNIGPMIGTRFSF